MSHYSLKPISYKQPNKNIRTLTVSILFRKYYLEKSFQRIRKKRVLRYYLLGRKF